MNTVIIVLTFVAGFMVILGINTMIADMQQQHAEELRDRMQREQRKTQVDRAKAAMRYRELYELAAKSADESGGKKALAERVAVFFEQAGGKTTPARILALSLWISASVLVATYLLTGLLILTVLAAAVAGVLPIGYVAMQRKLRLNKLLAQLPDTFDLMSRTMRAGQTFSQALLAIADEGSPPLSEEFGYCYDQQNLGMTTEAAMRDLARRTGLLEIRIFVLAVLIHRQTGGNLSELLEKLSGVMRSRQRIQGMIKGLTAEGKMQAAVLMALPVGIFGVIFVSNRPYAMELFYHPWLFGSAVTIMTVGALWIRKIINFDH